MSDVPIKLVVIDNDGCLIRDEFSNYDSILLRNACVRRADRKKHPVCLCPIHVH